MRHSSSCLIVYADNYKGRVGLEELLFYCVTECVSCGDPALHHPLGTSLLFLGEGESGSVSPARLVCMVRLELSGCGKLRPSMGGFWLSCLCMEEG